MISDAELNNRFSHHAPKAGQPEKYHGVRTGCRQLAGLLVALCPDSRELATALTHLDAVMFNANAAIARRSEGAAD